MGPSWLPRVGLRVRVVAVATTAVASALTIGAILLVGLLRSRLDATATTAATLRARDVAGLASTGTLPHRLALLGEESAVVQVIDREGTVIAASENIAGEPPITNRRPVTGGETSFTALVTALNGNDPMQIVEVEVATADGPVTVVAGESLERSEATTRVVGGLLLVTTPVLVGLVAGLLWWAVGSTLRPVRAISHTLAEITATDLHRRVRTGVGRDEIGQLAETINDTLERLDTSVERQRGFVADASHELRGPLAALRADLEISLAHPGARRWTEVARDTLSDVERLQALTEDLLVLARFDEQSSAPSHVVDLAAIVVQELAAVRRVDIMVDIQALDQRAMVRGYPAQLHRMVRNILHNAEQHASSTISVAVRRTSSTVLITITDDGPGIPPGEREHVFERFVRLDSARNRDTGGTGLGLAIVLNTVKALGGDINLTGHEPHGTTVTIDLPAA